MTDIDPAPERRYSQRRVSRAEASAAARVKVTVDKKLGRETPAWIRELARG